MTKILRVSVPVHITGIWHIVWGRDYSDTGSIGAGLNLSPYMYLEVRPWSRDVVVINEREYYLKHVTLARELLSIDTPLRVECLSIGDLGLGYAVSSAISIASCLYALIIGKASLETCLDAAHVVEVKLRTGLGDVAAQVAGGPIEIRLRPGAPSRAVVRRVNVKDKVDVIVAEIEREESTPEMLTYRYINIQRVSRKLLEKLLEDPSLDLFLEVAYEFSRKVGFLPSELIQALSEVKKHIRGAFAKKRLLVVVPEPDRVCEVFDKLRQVLVGMKVRVLHLAERGLQILA